jgi:DNA-binding protein WhiA
MSFSTEVKEQLSRVSTSKSCCKLTEFAAFLRMSGNITFGGGNIGINCATANIAIAKRYFRMAKEDFGLKAEMMLQKSNKLQKNTIYTLNIPPQPETEIVVKRQSELLDGNPFATGQELKKGDDIRALFGGECCIRAYLRGAFLGNGFVSNPQKSYHLELVANSQNHADFLIALMGFFGLRAKLNERKKQAVVYLKDSEQISDFLGLIGAHKALLDWENVKIYKDRSNVANRVYNCDIANTNKVVDTGTRQARAAEALVRAVGYDKLPPSLREIAQLRIENPEASLLELSEMMDPPLSKSGVNHRLRKIEAMAEPYLKS